MVGSTIITEKDRSRLVEIISVEDLDDFTCLNLNAMMTLDFEAIVFRGGVKWAQGEPVQFDPERGMAIFKIDEAGLGYVLGRSEDLDEAKQADLVKLAAFVRAYGSSNLYVFETY